MRLPIRVAHLDDEAGYDLFRRLGAAMGQPKPSLFAAELRLDWYAIKAGRLTPTIAELADVDPCRLSKSTFRHDGESIAFRSITMERGEWTASARVCPRCLEADRISAPPYAGVHRRSWWDLKAISRCPDHGNKLIDRCDDCGCSILANGRGICSCGVDLVSATDPTSSEQWAWDRYVAGRLFDRPHPPVPMLDQLDFSSLKPAALSLAGLQRIGEERTAVRASVGLTLASQGGAVIETAMAAREPFKPERDQIKSFLDPLYSWLEHSTDSGRDLLVDAVRAYVRAHLPVTSNTTILGAGYENVDFVDRYEVQQAVGIDHYRLTDLYRYLVDPSARVAPNALHRGVVERIRSEYEQCISTAEAKQRLGLSPRNISSLTEIQGSILPRAAWSSSSYSFVRLSHVIALERTVNSDLDVIDKPSRVGATIQGCSRFISKTDFNSDQKGEIMNFILSEVMMERIKPFARLKNRVGPGSLVLMTRDVIELLGRKPETPVSSFSQPVPAPQPTEE